MPYPGPEPSAHSINRNPKAEWTEVENVPFVEGEKRELPEGIDWHELTLSWWKVLRVMPHAVLWTEGDWVAAMDLALLKNTYYNNEHRGTDIAEIRKQQDLLGFTSEARRKLRIKYVEPAEKPTLSVVGSDDSPVATPIDLKARLKQQLTQ